MLRVGLMDPSDETNDPSLEMPLVLPKHLRFARSLALVSGAVIGIAAGAAVFGSGCFEGGLQCTGVCGVYGVQPRVDAHYDAPVDQQGGRADGSVDTKPEVPPDGHAGGGPRPAPRLPADWLV
ncbi:MAG TPA: hypothetical protein VKZ18_13675 [Polyangia bacterium]|nr:hypothetical protein [Polyangia bacterium]